MKKYIKYFIKILKTFIYSYEAKPLIKFKNKHSNNTLLSLKYNNESKNIYYIIRRTPGAGLFSNVIFALNHLKIANSCGYNPLIDMENFPTIYNEKKIIDNSKNAWNYYFKNKKKYDLKKIYKDGNYILTSNRFSKTFSHQINNNEFRVLFDKYFQIKSKYHKFVNIFRKRNFSKNKVLAIHLRGTSYKTSANHPFPTTKEQTLNFIDKLIKKYGYTKLFLCTEDLSYFNLIKEKFGKKVLFLKDAYKSHNDDAFKNYARKLHRYKLGRDILIEAMLISKCDGFVYTNTNVSEFVKFLYKKKKLDYFSINNGLNSSNAYVAKWMWLYKNLFPPFLGGFKDQTYVKKN